MITVRENSGGEFGSKFARRASAMALSYCNIFS